MLRIAITLALLSFSVPSGAASVAVSGGGVAVSGSTPVTRLDDFNRTSENPLAGNWSTPSGFTAMLLGGGDYVTGTDTTGSFGAVWNADSFAANQFSAVEATGTNVGVIVRVNSTACYLFKRTTGGTFQMYKLPAWDKLGDDYTSVSFTDGQVIRLEATGTSTTTLTPIVNGVTLATRTDSSSAITSGGVGIMCESNITSAQLDDWAGGEL